MTIKLKRIALSVFAIALLGMTQFAGANASDKEETRRIALQAYLYTYPMVLMDVTRRQMTNSAPGEIPGRGPMMQFTHLVILTPISVELSRKGHLNGDQRIVSLICHGLHGNWKCGNRPRRTFLSGSTQTPSV